MTNCSDAMSALEGAVEEPEDSDQGSDSAAILSKPEQEIIECTVVTIVLAWIDNINDPIGICAGTLTNISTYYKNITWVNLTESMQKYEKLCSKIIR